MNEDFEEWLQTLVDVGADFVIVGAHALSAHGIPRATGDLDVLVRADDANAERVLQALLRFGAPVQAHDLDVGDFNRPDRVYQMGLPPRRIDILTSIDGVTWDEVDRGAMEVQLAERTLRVLGLREFIRNKAASGRPKDRADLALLAEAGVDVHAFLEA